MSGRTRGRAPRVPGRGNAAPPDPHRDAKVRETAASLRTGEAVALEARLGGGPEVRVEGAPLDAPLVTRGVLLDPARAAGRPWLRDDAALDAAQLDDCAERQGAWIEPGDAVLVRTGFLAGCRTARSTETWRSGPAPGLAPSCARWLRDRGVVLVGIDSPRLESRGPANPPSRLRAELLEGGQVHMAIGLDLEALGRACGADGDWSFLFVCPAPRRAAREATSGAVIHPLAIR